MKSPEKYIALPLYADEPQMANSSKIGTMDVPKVEAIDIDNVIDGKSYCIVDYIRTANDGEFDDPINLIILVKKVAAATPG